jgi:hypothetical protein
MNHSRLNLRSARCALALLALAGGPGFADELFAVDDVKGDDSGTGALLYPNRPDMKPGDLDLVRLSAEQRKDGVWFVVEMAQPIRSPVGQVTELGQTPLDRLARNGFYTFNVDIYVDTDRIAGAGSVESVPGRRVTVDRNFAWDRAIVLTPRPDIARTMLQMHFDKDYETQVLAEKGRVSKEDVAAAQARSEQRVDELYFFPNRVRVSGRKVEFLVPAEFLGGVPSQSWAYTVLVTGADIAQNASPAGLVPDKLPMMTMGVARGITSTSWGIRADVDAGIPPVVDLLAPNPDTQPTVLYDFDTVAGRLANVPGVAPDGNVAVAPTGKPLTMEQAARLDTAAQGADASAAPATSAEKRAVPARLRTLNQLLEDGLITQAEYDELRRKILAEL